MLLLGTKNVVPQDLAVNELINLGTNYSVWCKTVNGVKAFSRTDTSVTLQQQGKYHITAVFVAGGEAGIVTFQALSNGVAIPGILTSETITTADTQIRTFVIDFYVTVDSSCVLGVKAITPQTIAFQNTGVESTISSVVVNIDKVVGAYA